MVIIYRHPEWIFKSYFRVDQDQFQKLVNDLRPHLERQGYSGRLGLPVELKVAVGLIILGRGESCRGVEHFGVAKSTANSVVHLFLSAVVNVFSDVVKLPDPQAVEENKRVFRDKILKNLGREAIVYPPIIGATDGSHIRCRPPRSDRGPWYNRKQYPSINVQATCDGKCRFIDVCVGAPGCVHDARVFEESGLVNRLPPGCIILGKITY